MGITREYHRHTGENVKSAPGFSTSYGMMNQWVSLSERGALSNAHQERPSGAEVFLTAPHDVGIGGQYNPKRMDITRLWSKKHGNQPHELHTGSMSAREPEYRDSDAGAGCPPMSSRENPYRVPPHLTLTKSGGYDDFHKTFLKIQKSGVLPSYPSYGPPRLRQGRQGSSWRHIKEVMQAKGQRTVFIDGHPRIEDSSRLLYRDVHGGNVIQPTVKSRPMTSSQRIMNTYKYMIDPELTAFKSTESGNWSIVR